MSLSPEVIREKVALIGDEQNLIAIVSEPPQPRTVPGVLILNAGVLHRIGPHRLHVRLARKLALMGHVATRLDLSGIGDSRALPGRMTFRESSVADIRAALDQLAEGDAASTFILFGICSGADNALAAAEADARIVSLVLVDPPAYVTARARIRRVLSKLGRVDTWIAMPGRVLGSAWRRLGRGKRLGTGFGEEREAPTGGRETPPAAEYGRQLDHLIQRGVRILAIYSGALGDRYNHRDQFYETFPGLRGKIECAYFPDANHTFTELAAQSALESTVLNWCAQYSSAA